MPQPGSIAIVAFGSDNPDTFSIVILDTSLRGQTLYVTDNGWQSAGGFRLNEGTLSYTVPANAQLGDVIQLSAFTGPVTGGGGGGFALNADGDQILFFTGSVASPTFLYAADFADGNTTWAGNATSASTSAVPPGLTTGETAINFGADNGVYTGPTTGTVAEILANIANSTNWTTNETASGSFTGGFTVTTPGGGANVTINDVTITEGNSGTSTMTFTVTRTNTDGAFSVDFATANGSATAGSDYVANNGTLNFTAGGAATQTISVTINGDTAAEGNETFTVNLSNLVNTTGTAAVGDASGTGTITNDDVGVTHFIHDIQGDAFFSPILAAEGITTFNQASTATVTVRAVVTALDTFGSLSGFYISEETADWDSNWLTSEGMFVQATAAQRAGITLGETVTITARVMEFQDFTNLNRTILTGPLTITGANDNVALPTFELGSDGHLIPTMVTSNDNPDFTDSADSPTDTFDPEQDALDYYETIEGMRVTLPDAVVGDGFVGGSNDNFVYFNAYSSSLADQSLLNSRGGYTIYGDPEFYPSEDTATPNDDVVNGGRNLTDGAQHPDIIELDFGNVGRGGTAAWDQLLTMGDQLGDVTGILDFDFGVTKLFVTDALAGSNPASGAAYDAFIERLSESPEQEVTTIEADDRSLRVATFNVENLSPPGTPFDDRGPAIEYNDEEKFDQLVAHIADNLGAPDILIIEEILDNNGILRTGTSEADETWELLISKLNAATGKTYQWVDEAPAFVEGTGGDVGGALGGNQRVGFLYDTGRVQLGGLDADASLEDRRRYTDVVGDNARTAGDLIAVDDTGLGIDPSEWSGTRRSIVGEFMFNGQTVYVFGSHLPSKGGSGEPFQINQNNDAGAPANGDWDLRNRLAEDLWQVQNRISTTLTDARLISGGDFNEFWFYRPMEVLTGYANPDGTANTTGTKYTNLMVSELAPNERFSYDFDGRSQVLDSLIVDAALAEVASFDVVHINTGYNDRAGAVNPASSDHDPSLASFDMRNFDETLRSTAADEDIDGFGGEDTVVFSGDYDGYIVSSSNNGIVVRDIDATDGDTGTDVLTNVEQLQFADQAVAAEDLVQNVPGITPTEELDFELAGTINLGGAEIVSFDAATQRAFVTSSTGLSVVDLTDPSAPTLIEKIDFTAAPFGFTNDINSVAVGNGVIAVAVGASPKTDPGKVFLLDADGNLLGQVTVGALPDHLSFTPDGTKILVANEGEIAPDGTDPEGSVSIIDISGGAGSVTVSTAGFASFNDDLAALKAEGVRLFAGITGTQFASTTVAQDLEPEYIAISPDGLTAMVTLQEANAVALLDIATGTFTDIVPLGLKDWLGLAIDTSDRDGPGNTTAINLQTDQPIFGMYMPDAIASYTGADGQTYYVIANEGDNRDDFIAPDETVRVGSSGYDLDNATFANEAALKGNAELGRLNASNYTGLRGDTDNDGDVDQILTYGGRSFSILDADGNMVFDSADQIERFVASLGLVSTGGVGFDDTRSDDKGAEPEGVSIGVVGDRVYAFVTLERSNGTMVYDVTDTNNVSFVDFVSRDGDTAPEIAKFIAGEDTANGSNLLLVANEGSGTLTIYEAPVEEEVAFTLQLLHFSDAEAGTLAPTTAPNLAALVDAFEDDFANSITLSSGDNFLPGPFLAAGTDPSVLPVFNSVAGSTLTTLQPANVDIQILNEIGVQASAIGNHEFDLGSNVLLGAFAPTVVNGVTQWTGADFPYLSSNIVWAPGGGNPTDPINGRFTQTVGVGGLEEAADLRARTAPSAVITEGGERIGIVGVTTQILESISSPSGAEIAGFPYGPGANGEINDMAQLAALLQPVINDLRNQGVNKIVLLSHLQQIQFEQALAPLLEGVDIIIAGGSNTRLGDADDEAVAFPGHSAEFEGTYPIVTAGADGATTLIVNTDGEFTYLGKLVVDFDEDGEIILGGNTTDTTVNGAYAATDENVAEAWGVDVEDLDTTAFADGTRGDQVQQLTDAVQNVIELKDGNVYGYSDVYLEGERSQVRSQETNLGNLSADANADAARDALGLDGETTAVVSIKNGGGIRAQIGTIETDEDGVVTKVPPEGGEVSQLDTENALRFDNKLMVFDTTAQGLLNILNSNNATNLGNGGFIQIGGVSFSFDPTRALGQRVRDVVLLNEAGEIVSIIANDGVVVPGAPDRITAVILNFTAQGGDGYNVKANGENFRFLLNDGSVSAAVSESLDFTIPSVVPSNALGEQQAFADYLEENYGTPEDAYDVADTSAALDTRIQNTAVRTDAVLDGDYRITDRAGDNLVRGTNADDDLRLLDGNDVGFGAAGNDRLSGGNGNDTLSGDEGNDIALGNAGNDSLFGNAGDDDLRGLDGEDRLSGGSGLDILAGGNGGDVVDGGADNDTLFGMDGNDQLFGGLGDDYATGGTGNDTILGEDGADRLYGGDGDDVINGGAGRDILTGNTGADRFVYSLISDSAFDVSSRDRIDDFSRAGGDKIDLSAIDADDARTGDQAFVVVDRFTATTGEIRIYNFANSSVIVGDVDGNGAGDFAIVVRNNAITADDLIL